MKAMSNNKFAIMMAMIIAVTPFAIDAYLPGIPYMADFFSVGSEQVATTISLYVLGMASGQLVGGPLADYYGKRYLILGGLIVYVSCCLLISQTHSLLVVQVCRFLQAIGGGFAMVCVAPLIRERAYGDEAAKLFSLIGLIMVAAPAIAPGMGALLISLSGWQSIFYFLTVYALLVMIITGIYLPRESKPVKQSISIIKRYQFVISNRPAMLFLLAQGCSFSVMLVFVTNASFIYQEYFQLSDQTFSLLFSANIIMIAFFNRYNRSKLNTSPAIKILRNALLIQILLTLFLSILVFMNAPVQAVAANIILLIGLQGAISPNTNALYISHFSEHTGSASALAGTNQFLMAALTGWLSTWLHNGTLWPAVLIMFTLSFLANCLLLFKPKTKVEPCS